MHKARIFLGLIAFLLVLQGCKSTQKQASETSKYKRKPITEVSQTQLDNDAVMIEAKIQSELGNFDQAVALYKSLLKKDSTYSAAYYELGSIYYMKGVFTSAIQYTKKAHDLSPNNVWYKLQLADSYMQSHKYPEAIEVLESLVKLHPEVLEYYYKLANTYISNRQIEKAIGVFNRVEKRIGVSEEISIHKQRLWEALGKQDKAIEEIEALADAFPHEVKYNSILAELFMAKKNYNKAFVYYNRVLKADPDDKYIHVSLASYYRRIDEPEKAYNELKTSFEKNALSSDEKVQILTTFYTAEEFYGKYSKYAYDLVDVIMKNNPDTMTLSLFYGDVLMRQRKYAEAARQFNNYIKIDSSDYNVWEALLICESEIPNNDKHLVLLCDRVINLFPTFPLAYYMKGYILYSEDNYATAIEILENGLKWVGDNQTIETELYVLLAECFYRIGKYDEAYKYFDNYLEQRPNDVGVLNNYAYYLAEHDTDLEKAEKMSKKAINADPNNATFLDTYGWILYKMGKYDEAETNMRLAIENDKAKSPTLLEHYADILEKLGKTEKAKEYKTKAEKVRQEREKK